MIGVGVVMNGGGGIWEEKRVKVEKRVVVK